MKYDDNFIVRAMIVSSVGYLHGLQPQKKQSSGLIYNMYLQRLLSHRRGSTTLDLRLYIMPTLCALEFADPILFRDST